MHKLTSSKLLERLKRYSLPSDKFLELITQTGDTQFISFCKPHLNDKLIDYQKALNLYLSYWAQRRDSRELADPNIPPLYEKKKTRLR